MLWPIKPRCFAAGPGTPGVIAVETVVQVVVGVAIRSVAIAVQGNKRFPSTAEGVTLRKYPVDLTMIEMFGMSKLFDLESKPNRTSKPCQICLQEREAGIGRIGKDAQKRGIFAVALKKTSNVFLPQAFIHGSESVDDVLKRLDVGLIARYSDPYPHERLQFRPLSKLSKTKSLTLFIQQYQLCLSSPA